MIGLLFYTILSYGSILKKGKTFRMIQTEFFSNLSRERDTSKKAMPVCGIAFGVLECYTFGPPRVSISSET
jgi:hypothetical protein